jgi:hypothetical protein
LLVLFWLVKPSLFWEGVFNLKTKNMIQLFNIQLNGIDAKNFCKLSREKKVEFIKIHTNQNNDFLIDELLNSSLKKLDCGCGCGGNQSGNGNISSDDAEAGTIVDSGKPNRGTRKKDSTIG